MVSHRGTAPFALAVSLALVAGCGGGGKKSPQLGTPSSEVSSTTEPATTSTTIDPALQDLLLVAADVPTFKEDTAAVDPAAQGNDPLKQCDTELPAVKAVDEVPRAEGATFVRGVGNAVSTTSSASVSDAGKAEAALTELVSAEAAACYEAAVAGAVEAGNQAGAKATAKTTATKSSVPGIDQVVLLSSAVTVAATAGKAEAVRYDIVFMRSQGTVVVVVYRGPTTLTSVAERQKIVGAVSKKLAASVPGSTGTSGSSTSVTGGGSSTTKRSTTTTRRSSTTTSSTTKASTTSSTKM